MRTYYIAQGALVHALWWPKWESFKRKEYQTTLPISLVTCLWVKKKQLESDVEQLMGSKSGEEYNNNTIAQ